MTKLSKTGLAIVAIGTVPLLLYIMFGPADGNPIGLGLLAWASWFVGGLILILGWLWRLFTAKRD